MGFSDDLTSLLQRGTDLPTLPDVVLELRKALDDDMTGDARIADIIERGWGSAKYVPFVWS